MSTIITFSDVPISDFVTDQFSEDFGVTFTINETFTGLGARAGTVFSDDQFGAALDAGWLGGEAEFPWYGISGTFTSPNHSRIGISVNQAVPITAKDETGNIIGSAKWQYSGPNELFGQSYFYTEFATGNANIAAFEMLKQQEFEIASVTFDTAGIQHSPDFRLMLSDYDIPSTPGQNGYIDLIVARLYGSNGPIDLAFSSDPSSLWNSPGATFSGSDGDTVRIPLEAVRNSLTADAKLTISGTPEAASAGRSVRVLNMSNPGQLGSTS